MIPDNQRVLHLLPRHLQMVMDILQKYLPKAEVWAYGSRVNGDHFDASDLDLVVRQPEDLNHPQEKLWQVNDAFVESNLPIIVQIVDWASIPQAFHAEIEAGYVVLKTPAK